MKSIQKCDEIHISTPKSKPGPTIKNSKSRLTPHNARSVNALNGLKPLHGPATFLLELVDEALAFPLEPFFAILCVPHDPLFDGHLLLRAGQGAFHTLEDIGQVSVLLVTSFPVQDRVNVDRGPGVRRWWEPSISITL